MFTVADKQHEEGIDSVAGSAAAGSLLDQIVRDGARQMLAAALQAEVASYVEAFVNAPHLVALIRAGATFKNGVLVERDDQPTDESGGDQQAA